MERKLYKNELDLWKEVTKEDIKINSYVSEDSTALKGRFAKKTSKALKKNLKTVKKKSYETELIKSKLQVNKRMKVKLERGLIRP